MSDFLRMTKAAIARHGTNVTYKRVSIPVYNQFTGVATSSETNLTIKVYPRQVVATQFNMPNMIGREVIEFYVYAPDLGVEPAKANDKIVFNNINYVVDRVREFRALGAIVLYKVLAVRD